MPLYGQYETHDALDRESVSFPYAFTVTGGIMCA